DPEYRAATDESTVTGRVRDVVYLGAYTRYVIAIDGGGELVVVQQNLEMSSTEALGIRDRAVKLVWDRVHNRPVE
ncbi:MAG: TOBE domain-containing protein, partial [Actinomycetota bacterium]